MATNCTSVWDALYCDGPVKPDSSWDRCVDVAAQFIDGSAYGGIDSFTSPSHTCWLYSPADPGFHLGQPTGHIGDGL